MSHIKPCWHLPEGVTDKTRIAARIYVALNPDGSLASEPLLVALTVHPQGVPFAQSAIAAIKLCAPYTFLPAEEYKDGWGKLDMNFTGDPAAAQDLGDEQVLKKFREQQLERSKKGN